MARHLTPLFLALFIVAGCSSSKDDSGGVGGGEPAIMEPETGFRASGGMDGEGTGDPFWLLDVDYENQEIHLAVTGTGGFEKKMPLAEPLQRPDLDLVIYRQSVGGETIEVSIFKRPCTNSAGKTQEYAVKINYIDGSGQADGRTYEGCGQFNGLGEMTRLWQLVKIDGEVVSSIDAIDQIPTIEFLFDETGVRGSGSCNRFTGEVEIVDVSTIKVGNLAATKMACPELDRETTYLGILSNTTHRVEIKGETMTLTSEKGVLGFQMK